MVFSSNIFLFLYFPIFLSVYYLVPFKYKSALILVASMIFYAWWRVDFTCLFLANIIFNYLVSWRIFRNLDTPKAKMWVTIGVVGNLSALFYFKYFNFGVDSLNAAITGLGGEPMTFWHVLLPIGISFYVFHSISYIVDVYRKDAPPADSFFDFAAFVSLFPQLVAGPVLRYKDLVFQFQNRVHSFELFNLGCQRFMIGFCKKVLIADTVAPLADAAFLLPEPTMMDSWIGIIAYAVQLYFDFSGYSDMAIGIGLMMGFRFNENFNFPYISRSITEFWRRWHISLSTWLRDYLYIPLGGNRKGTFRTYFNLWLTMVLGGIWHGANWTFVVWGLWHGTILAIERYFVVDPTAPSRSFGARVLSTSSCIVMVLLGWVAFRAPDLETMMGLYRGMIGLNGIGLGEDFVWQMAGIRVMAVIIGVGIAFGSPWLHSLIPSANPHPRQDYNTRFLPVWVQATLLTLFLLAVTRLSAQSFSPFLYFQF
jgi:alginate O-acetyltransferase complex protein AlgI